MSKPSQPTIRLEETGQTNLLAAYEKVVKHPDGGARLLNERLIQSHIKQKKPVSSIQTVCVTTMSSLFYSIVYISVLSV